jgi:protocatechuate 3,4-dioxygenase beta subunit
VAVIRGHVVDPQGHPVAEAAVYVISAPTNMPDIAQLTDEQGQFTMSAPVPGRYTLGARSDDWGSAQSEVEVGSEEPVTVEVQFNQPKEERNKGVR